MPRLLLLILTLLVVKANAQTRPNFLFILADDQSPFELKVYEPSSKLDTPNIDKLAREGMVIDQAYHMGSFSGAVCTPSRHMIMSGRTLWHLPIGPNAASCPPHLEKNTMAAVFNRAGYHTMRTCKKGNSYPAANKEFTINKEATKRGGTAEGGSAWHADRVLDYLREREAKKDTAPFLIYFGFSHPHDTRDGTPELLAKYGSINHKDPKTLPPANPAQPPLPPNWLPAHPFPLSNIGIRDEVDVSGVWKNRDERTIRNENGRQHACSENIDIQIGQVLKKLEETGELANTYVIYTSDHGIAVGRHGIQGKQNLYEHTWRVPYIVKGPGIKGGTRAPGNIYLLDTLATLCDLAGINAPKTNEGTSFRPVLEGKESVIRDVLYGAYAGGPKPGERSVRKGDWKLIEIPLAHKCQLFNLTDNPYEYLPVSHDPAVTKLTGVEPKAEQTDLSDDPRYADKLKEMKALLASEMQRLDDPFPLEAPQKKRKR